MCVRVSARVCVCVCVYVLEQRVVSSTLLDLIHHSHAAQVWVGESVREIDFCCENDYYCRNISAAWCVIGERDCMCVCVCACVCVFVGAA